MQHVTHMTRVTRITQFLKLGIIVLALPALHLLPDQCRAGVITKLPTSEKVVALTMDACETKTPSFLDRTILDFIVKEKIPCTIFVSGKFALRNRSELAEISRLGYIRIENHSMSHHLHMEKLPADRITAEVRDNERIITEITGMKPTLFRFPGGNFDTESLGTVESLGYRVVHWTFASGDPDKGMTAKGMERSVLAQTAPGTILIFHINGRGYHTGEALPHIVEELRRKGFTFTSLEDSLHAGP